jgi:hypothetical protein
MIYVVGDSHAAYTFAGVPGVVAHHLGPVTLRRAGGAADPLLPAAVAALGLTAADTIIWCFGEIDCRCHVKPLAEHLERGLVALLEGWVDAYLTQVQGLPVNGARAGVLAVLPPVEGERAAGNAQFPAAGTDAERAGYVGDLNRLLATGCAARGLLFVDVHAAYADARGLLPLALSDGHVHVCDTEPAEDMLVKMGLLP